MTPASIIAASIGAVFGALLPTTALANDYVGLDPYNRPIYAREGAVRVLPNVVSGPHYRRTVGQFGGPAVAGPLFYATPVVPEPGLYRPDPLVASGAILAFDNDTAFAQAERREGSRPRVLRQRPAPFSGEWYRACATRYRSFDPETGTYQPTAGPRKICR